MSGCSSSVQRSEVTPRKKSIPKKKPQPLQLIPPGLIDVTSQTAGTSALYILMDSSNSCAMILREYLAERSTTENLQQHDICFLGNISLRTRTADLTPGTRITRMPGTMEEDSTMCMYVYAEYGLLRRVVVFERGGKLYELELQQLHVAASFDALTRLQLQIAHNFKRNGYKLNGQR